MKRPLRILTAACLTLGILAAGGSASEPVFPTLLETNHLPNVVRVHEKVISGGLPEGADAFSELRRLGIKTLICVDGAQPDVALARAFGMRYVHLPHGYDGIQERRVLELAKAVRVLEGPIYIHCHHGRHRSPAAASAACVTANLLPPSAAEEVLRVAGTSPHYEGLFQTVTAARPVASEVLETLKVEFRSKERVPPLAEAMVALERTHERVLRIAENGWNSPADHPDLDPSHEALLLKEHFVELERLDEVAERPEGYREMLRASSRAAAQLEHELRSRTPAAARDANLQRYVERITHNCRSCHRKYRDSFQVEP